MTIVLDGSGLTLEQLVRVARDGERRGTRARSVGAHQGVSRHVRRQSQSARNHDGINTGIGEFSEIVLSDEQVLQFQRYLIYNHAAGIGEPAPIEQVRGAMAGQITCMRTVIPAAGLRSR